jgi:SAM-dependent methyltransferase
MQDQDEVFKQQESNAWFHRNKSTLEQWNPDTDFPLRLLSLYDLRPRRVLEIGASCGFRVAHLASKLGVEAVAVDPSEDAIAYGQIRYSNVTFIQSLASSIPIDSTFDLVIVNFVLHWVDRTQLLGTVAEIDRLVSEDGHLLLGDFSPGGFCRVRYHHREDIEVYTYKQDYGSLFLQTGRYYSVAQLTTTHNSDRPLPRSSSHERIQVSLLHKDSLTLFQL